MLNISQLQKVSFAFFIAAIFACQIGWGQTPTNSSCFSITVTTYTDDACVSDYCDPTPDEGKCTYCYEVTITNTGCPGLTINRLIMTTPGDDYYDCRSVCSPSGDFNVFEDGDPASISGLCSWVGPRYLNYLGNGGNGIPYLGTAKFVICRKAPPTGTMTYFFSCGCSCGGVPCTDGKITF